MPKKSKATTKHYHGPSNRGPQKENENPQTNVFEEKHVDPDNEQDSDDGFEGFNNFDKFYGQLNEDPNNEENKKKIENMKQLEYMLKKMNGGGQKK